MKRAIRFVVACAVVATSQIVGGAPSSSAAGCTLAPTNGTVTKVLAPSSYRLRVPSGLSGPTLPLQLHLHGGGGSGAIYEQMTGWSTYADAKKNFVIAYPNSPAPGFWNYAEGSSDVTFLRNVVNDIAATYCIDPKRIFVDGHSNGAIMADRLACDAEDKFAAFAPYAGASAQAALQPSGMGGCQLSRPVPIAMFHGDADSQAPIAYQEANRDWRIAQNGCATTPIHSSDTFGTLDKYTPCDGGADIWWRVYPGHSHAWPTGAENDDHRDKVWQFFTAHPLP